MKTGAHRVRERSSVADAITYQRRRFGNAKGAANITAGWLRQICEELATVVVDAATAANHEFALIGLGRPRKTETRRHAPLPALQRGVADAGSGVELVVAGDFETGVVHGKTGGRRTRHIVERGIEVEHVAVLLGKAAVIVITETGSDAQVRAHLPLVLSVAGELIGPVITVGVVAAALSVSALHNARAVHIALKKVVKAVHRHLDIAVAIVGDVELGVAVTASGYQSVLAQGEDHIRRGVHAVLVVAHVGERAGRSKRKAGRILRAVAKALDRDAGKARSEGGSGRIGIRDKSRSDAKSSSGSRLFEEAVRSHAHKTQPLLPVEARAKGDGVVNGCDLRPVLLRHREPGRLRVAVWLGHGRILVKVLCRQPVPLADVVIKGDGGLVGCEHRGADQIHIGHAVLVGGVGLRRWDEVLAAGEFGVQQGYRNGIESACLGRAAPNGVRTQQARRRPVVGKA